MKIKKLLSKKIFCLIVGTTSLFLSAKAQIPAKCFEIESILVDACNSTSLEPNNEMVRFRVGPNPINISDIRMDGRGATGPYVISAWPTTTLSWFGLIQNAATATTTATLQATVVSSCGELIEPPGGIIPRGANVLMIASTNVSTVDNSFSTLTDTLYIVYHNASYLVTTGHFKNYTVASSTRSIILNNTATGCSDTATYDVSLLTNISGGNGDRVDFSWSGIQTYLNDGCNAPFIPITAIAGSDNSVCVGTGISFTGIATGNFAGLVWQSNGSGVFSNSTALTTTFTPSNPGTYLISFGAITPCNDTIFSFLNLTVLPLPIPVISASGSTNICTGSNVVLTASGGSSYLWNTGAASSAITVSSSGTYTVTATNGCGSVTATQTVTVTPLPVVTLNNSGSSSLCVGSSSILWATGVGNYLWSTGSTNDSITVTTGGTYLVTASNSCGSVSSSIIINTIALPSPIISASGSTNICTGSNVVLTASGGSSYLWNTGAASSAITVSSSGTYTVTATNGCGSVTATQTVTVTPLPVVTLNNSGSSSLCVGSSSILWATGVGNYLWSTGSTNDSITVTTGGTYLVTASNSCGSVSSSIIINTIALPSPIITASGSTSICVGDSVTLVASGGDLYSWNTFDTTAIITVFTSGIYTVNVTNVCGSQTASQSVIANSSPIVSINSSGTSFCSGDSLLLWATGSGSFVWSGGAITDSVFITSAGNYFVTSTSSCGLATDTILVSELSLPNALIVPSGSTTICSGSTIVLDGFGGTSYLWFPSGATSDSTLVSSAGTYTLSATNSCGTDTATISITTLDIPTAAISPSGSTTICLGDILTLNASGSTSYLWSNGTTGNSLSVTSQGLYYVIASNICGSDTATINVVVDSVNALFSGNTLIGTYPLVVDFTNISSSTAITYSWSFGDGNSSSTFSPSNTFQTPGTYLVTLFVTNANGCTDSYAIQIIVLENPSELIIPNVFTPNNDNNNDLFVVRSSGLKEFNCVIYDRWGLEMIELASESMGWDGRTAAGVNVSDGTYYYIIKAQGLDGKGYNETGFVLLTR